MQVGVGRGRIKGQYNMYYRKGTFVTVPNKQYLQGQKPIVLTVYFWLCSFSDEYGECFPSRTRLAKDCGVTPKTIDEAVKKLEELCLIEKIKRTKKNGEWQSNLYQIIILDAFDEDTPSVKITPPSVKKDTTPSVKNSTLTKSNINSIQLTQYTEQGSEEYAYGKSKENTQIDEIIKEFESIDLKNKNNYGRNPQRQACKFLIDNYGYEMIVNVIRKVLPYSNKRPRYEFPFVATPHQLVENWEKIKAGMVAIKEKQVEKKKPIFL